jgi:hypothetical protein
MTPEDFTLPQLYGALDRIELQLKVLEAAPGPFNKEAWCDWTKQAGRLQFAIARKLGEQSNA